MHAEYYEGILQLRNCTKEVLSYVKEEAEKKGVKIAKEKKVPNGIDIYISSKSFLRSLGNRLQNTFGGELKMSARLITKDWLTSKDVHRLDVLFRMPTFKKGDTIVYRGEKIKVINCGKKVFGKKENGQKVHLDYKDLS